MTRDLEFDIKGRDKTGAAFDSATSRIRAFDAQIAATARTYAVLELAAKGFAAGIGINVIEYFGSAMRDAVTQAADLADLADKVGVSVEDLQRMTYGFEVASVAAGEIDNILTQWSKRIGDAHTNGGRLADRLKANGVALTGADGKLRSSVDLMRDYADLVANAASDQERAVLANEAFGKSGASMVLALRDGADGMDKLMRLSEEAGDIFENELVQRMGEFDDKLNAVSRTIDIGVRRGLMGMAATLDTIINKITNFDPGKASAFALDEKMKTLGMERVEIENEIMRIRSEGEKLSDTAVDLGFTPTEDPRIAQLQAREQALRAEEKAILDVKAARDAADAAGKGGRGNGGDDDGRETETNTRRTATAAMKDQESAYERIMQRLQEEQDMLGMNDVAQRVLIEQRRAGVEATSEQGRAIASLVEKIEAETKVMDAARDAADFMNSNLKQSFSDLLPQIETGNRALDGFVNRLAEAAAEAAFFGSGPLGSLFGGGLFSGVSGGGAASIMDPWAGMRDVGSAALSVGTNLAMSVAGGVTAKTAADPQEAKSRLKVDLAPGLRAEILQEASRNSVEIVRQYDRGAARDMVRDVIAQPRARG